MSESEIVSSFNPTIVTGTESREVGSLANFIGPSFNTGTLVKRNNVDECHWRLSGVVHRVRRHEGVPVRQPVVTLRLDPAAWAEVKEHAKERGITAGAWVRRVIERGLAYERAKGGKS